MTTVFRLLLFILSNLGMWEFLRRKTKIDSCFFPSLTIALQVSFLFVAGILNLLKEAVAVLWLFGMVCLCVSVARDRSVAFLKNYLNVAYIFCAVTMAVMLFYVKGKIFARYDNFSHWALVVKRMLNTNRYPNFEDTVIMFQEYPLGSATYIYFFSKIVNMGEHIQMLAQIYMMTACIMPVFCFAKKNRAAALAVGLSFTNFFFVYNITVTNLLVDTLLPIVGMCALLYVYLYCDDGEKTDRTAICLSAAYLTQIIQIKNSGIYFVLIAVVWILYKGCRNKNWKSRTAAVCLPFGSLILWQKHCRYVFVNAAVSKHAMTSDNYKSVFGAKSAEEIKTTCTAMLKLSVTHRGVWITFGILLLTGLLTVLICKEQWRVWVKAILFSVAVYVTYQVGMLGMYLFSMPGKEATALAGSDRYVKTILIAILYVAVILFMKILAELNMRKYASVAAAAVMFVLPFVYMQLSMGAVRFVWQGNDSSVTRDWMEQTRNEYAVPDGESYCVLIQDESSRTYVYFLGKYLFQSDDVTTMVVTDRDDLYSIDAKYIFVYDSENTVIQDWIRDNYPDQAGKVVIERETRQ